MTPRWLSISADEFRTFAQAADALLWPLILIGLLIYLGPAIRSFIMDSDEATLGALGFKATLKRNAESAVLYGMSVSGDRSSIEKLSEQEIQDAVNEFLNYLESQSQDEPRETTILWVDDQPGNNVYERETLSSFGIHFNLARTTQDALDLLRENDYDAIISDMGRPESEHAGYELLDAAKKLDSSIPFILYSYPVTDEHKIEAIERGAFGETESPRELFRLVRKALNLKIPA